MLGTHISINGTLVPHDDAHISIDDLAFTYGFGVYESLRQRKGVILFLDEHIDRLFHSASCIDLSHSFTKQLLQQWVNDLTAHTDTETSNIKVMLVGHTPAPTLYIFLLAPTFIETNQYRDGVHTITYEHERFMPQAKTLNMLPSYVAFVQAKKQNAFDALFIDRKDNIAEGTRTNIFAIQNTDLFTPPDNRVLAGITRKHVLACAQAHGFTITKAPIPLRNISTYDGLFLTSTSSGIVPIQSIDDYAFKTISPHIHELQTLFRAYKKQHHATTV
jgi:branched-chain amino acid aminotransferase